jgi:exosortase/archaeosortase family protein
MANEHRAPWLRVVRFSAIFLLLIAAYAVFFSTPWVERYVHAPMSRLVTVVSAAVLSLFGQVTVSGTHLEFDGFRAEIVEACNGVLPIYIFLTAVLAFPSTWPEKLRGVLLSVPVILLINLLRVVSLMILGAHNPDIVERVHIDVWQTAVVVLSMGIWIFWAERFVRPQSQVRR